MIICFADGKFSYLFCLLKQYSIVFDTFAYKLQVFIAFILQRIKNDWCAAGLVGL
jgi:hypothetical protein